MQSYKSVLMFSIISFVQIGCIVPAEHKENSRNNLPEVSDQLYLPIQNNSSGDPCLKGSWEEITFPDHTEYKLNIPSYCSNSPDDDLPDQENNNPEENQINLKANIQVSSQMM